MISSSDEVEHDLECISLIFAKASIKKNTSDVPQFTSNVTDTVEHTGSEKRQKSYDIIRRKTRLPCDGKFRLLLLDRSQVTGLSKCQLKVGTPVDVKASLVMNSVSGTNLSIPLFVCKTGQYQHVEGLLVHFRKPY